MASTSRILIFGSRGVGKALAHRLIDGGARVHVCSLHKESLLALKESVESRGKKDSLSVSTCDVMKEDSIRDNVLGACEALNGLLNGVAFAVGSIPLQPLQKVTRLEMIKHFTLNTAAAFEVVQAAAPALEKTKGSVVLFSSVAARQGFKNHAAIAAAKVLITDELRRCAKGCRVLPLRMTAECGPLLFDVLERSAGLTNTEVFYVNQGAVESLTVQMAAELAPAIRVNCIAPSLTNTSLVQNIVTKAGQASYAHAHPLKRIGEPEDVAAMAAFLLGPDATWITGQVCLCSQEKFPSTNDVECQRGRQCP